jgi:hypothetical protein
MSHGKDYASAVAASTSWQCGVCTFVHRGSPECDFLTCALCGAVRVECDVSSARNVSQPNGDEDDDTFARAVDGKGTRGSDVGVVHAHTAGVGAVTGNRSGAVSGASGRRVRSDVDVRQSVIDSADGVDDDDGFRAVLECCLGMLPADALRRVYDDNGCSVERALNVILSSDPDEILARMLQQDEDGASAPGARSSRRSNITCGGRSSSDGGDDDATTDAEQSLGADEALARRLQQDEQDECQRDSVSSTVGATGSFQSVEAADEALARLLQAEEEEDAGGTTAAPTYLEADEMLARLLQEEEHGAAPHSSTSEGAHVIDKTAWPTVQHARAPGTGGAARRTTTNGASLAVGGRGAGTATAAMSTPTQARQRANAPAKLWSGGKVTRRRRGKALTPSTWMPEQDTVGAHRAAHTPQHGTSASEHRPGPAAGELELAFATELGLLDEGPPADEAREQQQRLKRRQIDAARKASSA